MRSRFRLPRLGTSSLVSQWLGLTLVLSIIANLDGGWLEARFALIPSRVWLGEIWRLVTWPLLEPGPLALILTCVAIFRFGTDLSGAWGDRRLQRYLGHVITGTSIITVVVASLFDRGRLAHTGGLAIVNLLVITWARQFPAQPLVVYGMPLAGTRLIGFVALVTIVFAIYAGPLVMAPELAACAIAAWYPRGWLRR